MGASVVEIIAGQGVNAVTTTSVGFAGFTATLGSLSVLVSLLYSAGITSTSCTCCAAALNAVRQSPTVMQSLIVQVDRSMTSSRLSPSNIRSVVIAWGRAVSVCARAALPIGNPGAARLCIALGHLASAPG